MPPSPGSLAGWLLWLTSVVIATGIALLVLVETRAPTTPPATHPVPVANAVLANLEARLAGLEREFALMRTLGGAAPSTREPLHLAQLTPPRDETVAGAPLSGIDTRLKLLESSEAQRESTRDADLAAQERSAERKRAVDRVRAEVAQQVILDAARSDDEKARAWRDLRRLDAEAWTDEIVLQMLAVGNSEDPDIREDVWRGADGNHTSPLLVSPLLHALTSEPVPGVREEVADALSHYLDHPGVREALRRASELDLDGDVRIEAIKSLQTN